MSKKTITLLALAFSIFQTNAQTVADFETFSLSPNSAYSPTTSTPFQTSNAIFNYEYYSAFSLWTGGFSYTNKYDSSTAGYTNDHGVRAYKGYSNSATYVVGHNEAIVKLKAPFNIVTGFYITNTTYAYKSMASGDMFAKKFGDTTGTGSGTTIPQGSYPDFFKVVIKGYKNGVIKNDSVTYMLADFTFTNNAQDFILNSWKFVNTTSIGEVDSLQFFLRSSDNDPTYGMNTPGYFAIDNFETTAPNLVGIAKNNADLKLEVYPNPFQSSITINTKESNASVSLKDLTGKVIYSEALKQESTTLNFEALPSGIYFLELTSGNQKTIKKLIKN
ncbi:hypothetical protein CNR22_05055 [Sphingobacteriaceae bacterium]|nr:hypothetical protein CNR22_05055 [Sphingobacteriaceae bacterium]